MESEAKSKRSVPKSPPNDSIIRVLKYESDTDISSLPSKSKDSFSRKLYLCSLSKFIFLLTNSSPFFLLTDF